MNSVIRRIDATTGNISTVAGTGAPGYGGDGGAATHAQLNYPMGLALDAAGNLYIADTSNNVIREVNAKTGVISTILGKGNLTLNGAGRSQLLYPESIVFDGSDNLYISDAYGLLQLSAVNQTVTQLIGSYSVQGIAADHAGNVYFSAESSSSYGSGSYVLSSVYKIPAGATGSSYGGYLNQLCIAGCGFFSGDGNDEIGDGGPAINAILVNAWQLALDSSDNLYIADTGYSVVQRVDAKTGIITAVTVPFPGGDSGDGGLPGAEGVTQPISLAMDASGNLAIADQSARIRKLIYYSTPPANAAATPSLSVAAGSYGGPQTVTISDSTTGASIYYTLDGSTPTTASGGYFGPINIGGTATVRTIAVAPGYMPSAAASAVYSITSTPAPTISTVAGSASSSYAYCSSITQGTTVPALQAAMGQPQNVAMDSSGNLYISDSYCSAVWKVAAKTKTIALYAGTGVPFDYSYKTLGDGGPATSATLTAPRGIALDSKGNLYIADFDDNLVRKVDASTGIIMSVARNGLMFYSTDSGNGDGGQATSATIAEPTAVTFDSAGNLFVANSFVSRVRKIDAATGVISTYTGSDSGNLGDGGLATSATLTDANALAFDSGGNLYIADGGSRIRKVTAGTGIITTIAGTGISGFSGDGGQATAAQISASGFVADPQGNLYLSNGNLIRFVLAGSKTIFTIVGSGIPGYWGDGGAATVAGMHAAAGLGLDSQGNLYIADVDNDVVRQVAFATNPAQTALPSLTPAAGTYVGAQIVTIADTTNGAKIYYTTDGTKPTISLSVYSSPITVSASETLEAMAVASGYTQSAVAVANYTINLPKTAPTIIWFAPQAIPYGKALSATQLDATSTVNSTFNYSPSISTILNAGLQTLSVTLTPADTTKYTTAKATAVLTVNKVSPAAVLTASSSAVVLGNSVTLTATVSGVGGGSQPTGTVSFLSSSTSLGPGTLNSSGVATLTTSELGLGTDSITIHYAGDANYSSTTSAAVSIKVNSPATATIKLTSSASTDVYGASVTLTVTLTGRGSPIPTGAVTFLSGTTSLGSGKLNASGVASLAVTTLAAGTNSITASYPGDSNYAAANSTAVSVTITKASQTITFTAPATPVKFGVGPITLAATASSGLAVTFTATGPGPVSGNTLTIKGAGSVVVTANQAGNTDYTAATAVAHTITVNKATTAATLASSEMLGAYGAPVTLTATLTNAGSGSVAPTGTVTFVNGATTLGTGAPNASCVATVTLTTLPVGTASIKANYGGDANYGTASSAAVSIIVAKASQTINFTAPTSPVTYGITPIALSAKATSGLAITFTTTGPATVIGSTLTITGAGRVVVTANQPGNTDYSAAPAVQQTITVNPETATSKLTSTATSLTYGTSVTLTATLTGSGTAKPTGTATFLNGTTSVGIGTLNSSGVATLTLATLPVGVDSITVSFPGDTHYAPVASAALAETVRQATPMVKLTAAPTTAAYGAAVTLTATVSGTGGTNPSGTVTFLNGNTPQGTGPVTMNSSGVATVTLTSLPVGADSIKASYAGNSNYIAAASPATTVTITKASQTITFVAPATPVTYGIAPITLKATATSGLPVTFTATRADPVNNSTLSITGAGSVTVMANQSGNSNYAAADAVSKTITVNKATPTLSLTTSDTSIITGASVTFTAAVTGPGATAPTGTVTFMDGSATLGTGKLATGTATYSTTKLTTGKHIVTAKYGGDTNYGAVTSAGVTLSSAAK
jgi:hypothetical protein